MQILSVTGGGAQGVRGTKQSAKKKIGGGVTTNPYGNRRRAAVWDGSHPRREKQCAADSGGGRAVPKSLCAT